MAEEEAQELTEEEVAAAKKKKMMMFIIIGVVLLLGGGAAAFFLMGGEPAEGEEGAATEEVVEEVPLEEGEPIYHELKPKFIVNLMPGGPAGMLQLTVKLYTRNQEVADFMTTNDPMVRHHMINLLENQDSAVLLTKEGKEALQQSVFDLLTTKMKEMNGKGEIKAVYFSEFVMQ